MSQKVAYTISNTLADVEGEAGGWEQPLADETSARESADTDLQTQIDALRDKPTAAMYEIALRDLEWEFPLITSDSGGKKININLANLDPELAEQVRILGCLSWGAYDHETTVSEATTVPLVMTRATTGNGQRELNLYLMQAGATQRTVKRMEIKLITVPR